MSLGTLRWWYRAGRLGTLRDQPGDRLVRGTASGGVPARSKRDPAGGARFAGVVRSVAVDGMRALVEIEAGPFLFRAAVARDRVEELGLVEGSPASATVRGASVVLEKGDL